MSDFKKGTPIEENKDWKTGSECIETGTYVCSMHIYVEKIVHEGETFPKCDQKGIPHSTTWSKLG